MNKKSLKSYCWLQNSRRTTAFVFPCRLLSDVSKPPLEDSNNSGIRKTEAPKSKIVELYQKYGKFFVFYYSGIWVVTASSSYLIVIVVGSERIVDLLKIV